MNNGDILSLDVIHHYLPDLRLRAPVPQKQKIPTLKRGLHAARQHNHDGRRRVRHYRETFPKHEGGRQYEGEVEHLNEQLARLQGRERGNHGLLPFEGCGFMSKLWRGNFSG